MKKQLAIALLLFAIPATVLATNEGNGNGNGGPESGNGSNVGPQGPMGPQGNTGLPGQPGAVGPQGTAGSNGKDATTAFHGTDLVGDVAIRLYDGKRIQWQAFDTYVIGSHSGQDLIGDGRNTTAGLRFVFKLGSSYEEREIAKLREELKGKNVIQLPE